MVCFFKKRLWGKALYGTLPMQFVELLSFYQVSVAKSKSSGLFSHQQPCPKVYTSALKSRHAPQKYLH